MPKYSIENKNVDYVKQLAQSGEIFVEVTTNMVDGVYDYYQVSNFGRVYHNYMKIIMRPGLSTSGYHFLVFSTKYGKKIVQLHRLVLLAFNYILNNNEYQVNHKNGNKLCNYLWNLEWVTRSENVIHAYRTGLNHVGEDNIKSKIDNNTAEFICKLIEDGYKNKYIAELTGTTVSVVQDIRSGHGYKFISKDYNFNRRKGRKFTEEQVHNICNYFQNNSINNLTINEHCRNALNYNLYDSSPETIDCARKIYIRKYYTNISKNYKY